MTFIWPWALLSLLIIPLVCGIIWLLRRRRRRAAVRVTSIALVRAALPGRTRWIRLIPGLLLMLGFATLGVGAARPQASVPVASNSTTIMLAMDVSGSMCSTDVEPNRLTVAQQAAIAFIESQAGGTKIGLVLFAGVAGLQVPPTTDTEHADRGDQQRVHGTRYRDRVGDPHLDRRTSPRSTRPWRPPVSMRNRPSGRATRHT